MTIAHMSFNDVMEQNDAQIGYIAVLLWEIFGLNKSLSIAAKVTLVAIGHGMRLVVDHTKKREARLVTDPEFKMYMKHAMVQVPKHVADEID
jgi:hypothetical protein